LSDPHARTGAIDEAALDRAALSDADFFERHPHRTHRIRAAIAGELPGLVTPTTGWPMTSALTHLTARDVADRLGLRKHARSWRGACPACGYRDTFAVLAGTNGRARLFCASCNDCDGLADAVARVSGGFWQLPLRQDRAMMQPSGSGDRLLRSDYGAARNQHLALLLMPTWRHADCPALLHLVRRDSGPTRRTRKAAACRR